MMTAMTLRWIVTILFLLVALVATAAVQLTRDTTWQSIWAGVATTALAAAAVDAIALVERWREQKPVRQMVGRRIGRLHQILLDVVQTVFDDQHAEAPQWPKLLRELPDDSVDFETPANVYPPRSRRQYLAQLLDQFDDLAAELAGLAATGVLAHQLNDLDRAVRTSTFLPAVRVGVNWDSGRSIMAEEAAALLDQVQAVMPAAAAAAGPNWKYGSWPRRTL